MISGGSLQFIADMMEMVGMLFLTVQLWAPAWGWDKRLNLNLADPAGPWRHLVRDGFLLVVVGSMLHLAGQLF